MSTVSNIFSEQLRSYFGPSQNEILTKLENMITSLGQAGMKPKVYPDSPLNNY